VALVLPEHVASRDAPVRPHALGSYDRQNDGQQDHQRDGQRDGQPDLPPDQPPDPLETPDD
jgi:hypothetical protein